MRAECAECGINGWTAELMAGWQLVVGLNLVTVAAYLAIAGLIVRGLLVTRQLRENRLAVATAAIFLTCAMHHLLHGLTLVSGDPMQLSMMRESMGSWVDVLVTASTAVTGVLYVGLRRSYGLLIRSPALFSHATEVRYRQLAANLPHTAVFVVDLHLRFVLVAGSGLADAGVAAKDLEGRLVSEALSPEAFATIGPHYRAAVAGESSEFERVSGFTGAVFRNRARPLLDESGKIIGGLVLSEDVTAERATLDLLAQAQAFNAAVMAASPDIVTMNDAADGRLSWASRSILEMLGYPGELPIEAEGPRLRELLLEEDRPTLRRAHAAIADLADGEHLTCRYRSASADGHRWISRQSTPFRRDSDGAVSSYLSIVRDITDIVEVEQRMEHAALHDPLTNLPNRALLLDRMTSALARADRLDTEVAVLFCDLDGFKKVNDLDGHAAGDAVLIEIARRLAEMTRKSDSVARVGGDEFVIVLEPEPNKSATGTSPDGRQDGPPNPALREVAMLVADRVRQELTRPIEHLGRRYEISVSIGMTYAPRHSRAADVLRDADIALYRAKQRGKNRVEVFDEALGADIVERSRIEQVLRNALHPGPDTAEALTVAYQPVYDLGDETLVGFEALARLKDRSGHPVPPDAFIPIAEETGLITELGEQVLDEALACLVRWRHLHPDTVAATMAVNLSARQAQHADMPAVVRAALTKHRLEPADLILELTESVLLESGTSTLRQLTELRHAGVGIAIDDFGTGYASLRYLANLPVSSVKVDRSFTATMTDNHISATIVRAIATLAKDLGLDCVVEGVESADQLRALPAGVLGQGYLMGRPTAIPENTWLSVAS